ncbi:MAG TPA: TonB-dependent receptor [Sphingomicrobium sp.]|jgi:outer membrane receptor protein involved in Fe transport
MKKSILRASAGFQALALMGAGVTAGFIAAAPAAAQDYTSGGLTGTVTNASGAPVAGAAVTVRSLATGTTVNATTNAQGQFTVNQLAAGSYDVTVNAAGSRSFTATAVDVQPGRTTSIPVALASGAAAEGGIVVTGRRIQAFTGTTTGRTVDVSELVKTVPVGRTLADVTLLAPGTVQGDTSFTSAGQPLVSIGGSSVAENAYYINGLNITNFDNYLGSAEVPFDFYKTVEVKSGGYPAEFGRATGGIINATSKSGTNDITGGLHLNWAPDRFRSNGKDLLNCAENDAGTIECNPYTRRSEDKASSLSATVELGGPIIRDRLFAYGLVEMRRTFQRTINVLNEQATEDRSSDPFWGAKIDAFPIDGQHLEFTIFDTRKTVRREIRDWTDSEDGGLLGPIVSSRNLNYGGVNWVGKYTGRFTNWLTLSAAYGRNRDRFDTPGLDEGSTAPYIANGTTGTLFGIPSGGLATGQTTTIVDQPYETERKFLRGDADINVDFFGSHRFRVGFDREKNTLNHFAVRPGAGVLCTVGFLTAEACNANGGNAGAALIFRPAQTTGANAGRPIVEVNYYNSGGEFQSVNTAYYLQDEWKTPLQGLTLNLGVRRDDFVVNNPEGDTFISLKKNYAPRIGFTYDAFPSMRGQFFGSYGTYYLPIASNTAFRATSAEYYIRERYYVDALDANGLPILGPQVTNVGSYQNPNCALPIVPQSSGAFCNQTGNGEPKDPTFYLSQDLKPTKVAEWILGYRQKLGDFNVGVAFTNRSTKNLNEDASFDQAIINYCEANGIAGCADYYTTGSHQFAIANVGKDVTLVIDGGPLDGQTITIPAALTGYPKAKRTYRALDFTFDRPWDGRWSLGGSYSLSWSKGNSEGFVNSDTGQDDAGVLADWDFPGFMDYSYGYLPSDRRHKIKLFGAFAPIPQLILGANVQIESPRSLSCFGWHPTDYFANNYAAAYNHYCNGQPSPRGTAQKSDWNKRVNLSARYNLTVPATGLGVTLRADVFNVFNSRPVLYRSEIGELAPADTDPVTGLPTVFTPAPNYGQPRVYGSPRYVRLGLDVGFGGPAPVVPVAPVIAPPPPPPAAPATITCPDGLVILANQQCPVAPPPPPPPAPAPERGQ